MQNPEVFLSPTEQVNIPGWEDIGKEGRLVIGTLLFQVPRACCSENTDFYKEMETRVLRTNRFSRLVRRRARPDR